MLRYLFDTDHLTLFDQGHVLVSQRWMRLLPDPTAISAITVEEYLRGRLGRLARARTGAERIRFYGHLAASVRLFESWEIVPFDQSAEDQFQLLRGQGIRIGTLDLRIAAIALAKNLIVVTRNRRDFGKVPGLTIEDWSV